MPVGEKEPLDGQLVGMLTCTVATDEPSVTLTCAGVGCRVAPSPLLRVIESVLATANAETAWMSLEFAT